MLVGIKLLMMLLVYLLILLLVMLFQMKVRIKRFYSIFAEFEKGRQILIEMTGDRLYNIIARAGNDSSQEKNANTI